MTTATRAAAVYLRVSKDRTGEELAVDRQREDCIALAESLGWRVAGVYLDNDLTAYSGKPRPDFERMLADIQAGQADAVIAWHVDRLYRHPRDLEAFVEVCERANVVVRTVRAGELDLSTDAGRMVARILGAVARQEVERSTDRIRRSKQQAAEQGRYRGGPRPFGYEADGTTVRESEADVVREMTARVISGDSLRAIAHDLNTRGVTTSTGRSFTTTEASRIIKRGRNIARIEVQTSTRPRRTILGGPAQWPAIVSDDQWQQAQDILNDPDRVTTTRHGEVRHLLSGIAICGLCLQDGDEVHMRVSHGKRGGQVMQVYSCPRSKHVTRGAEQTDAYVGSAVRQWLARPEAAEVLATNPEADPVAVMAEVEKVRARIEMAREMWTDGLLDDDQMRASVESLRSRERDLLASLGQGDDATLTPEMLRAGWDALDIRQQRAIVRRFARVVLDPSPKGRPAGWKPGQPYFRTDTVRIDLGTAARAA
ncbi:MAG: recombinase family protein [Candidatus Nanopelagicales bacterium]